MGCPYIINYMERRPDNTQDTYSGRLVEGFGKEMLGLFVMAAMILCNRFMEPENILAELLGNKPNELGWLQKAAAKNLGTVDYQALAPIEISV